MKKTPTWKRKGIIAAFLIVALIVVSSILAFHPVGEVPPGIPHEVEYHTKALQHVSQTHVIPIEQLRVVNEGQANFPVSGRKIWGAKVWDGESSYGVYIDERGDIVDIKTIEAEESKAAHQKYGKLEPALFELLQTIQSDELVPCIIWLKMANVRPRRPGPDENEYAKYKKTLSDAYASAQRPVADFIRANGFSVTYTSRYAPLIYSKLPKWMIIELQNIPEVDMIYLAPKIEEGLDIAAEIIT